MNVAIPEGEAKPIRREDPMFQAVVLARAAMQSMFLFADVSWGDGWTARVSPGGVVVKKDDEVVVAVPIHDAAHMRLADDSALHGKAKR